MNDSARGTNGRDRTPDKRKGRAMTAMSSIRKGASMARIGAHMAWERITDPHPTRSSAVPRSAEYLTREWLTDALCADVPGAEVEDFKFLGAANLGTTARRNIEVRYNAAGEAAGLPHRIFAKATPEFASRYICGLSGAITNEVNFYNHIAGQLSIEIPACYYAAYDPGSFRSIFLFEDAGVTKQARFLNSTYRPSRAEVESMVRTMAALHSRFWGSPALDREFTWLKDPLTFQHQINDLIGFRERCALGLERVIPLLPPEVAKQRENLWPAMLHACALRVGEPRTLLHADIHLGNWYVTGAGDMGLCDWQCTVKGGWAVDFAYAISSSLDPQERRAWERDLLALYLSLLDLPNGHRVPSFDDAWQLYRQQMLHGFYNWLFVAGIGASQTAMHSNDIMVSNVTRMASAIGDHATLASLGY